MPSPPASHSSRAVHPQRMADGVSRAAPGIRRVLSHAPHEITRSSARRPGENADFWVFSSDRAVASPLPFPGA
jgi:hypothetical protein